jgi:hypothetical protein
MKKWADVKSRNGEFERVRIWDVLMFRESKDPEVRRLWNEREYLSTHKNPDKKCKMHPSPALKVFRYNPRQAPKTASGHKETLTHVFCKEVIQELGQLKAMVNKRPYEFKFSSVEDEFDIDSKIQNFRLDLFCGIESCSPTYLKSKWSGFVGIEIHVSNKTSGVKALDVEVYNQIALIEVHIPVEMRFNDKRDYTQEDEIEYLQDLKSYFMKHVNAEIISNPISFEFENQMLKKEIEQLKKDTSAKSDEVKALREKISNQENDQKKQLFQIQSLQSENEQLKKNLSTLKNELAEERSKSLIKRVLEKFQ